MKKVFSKIVISVIFVTMFSTLISFSTVSAASPVVNSNEFKVSLGTVDALPNKDVTVPITFENVPACKVNALNLTINYDPTKLEYLSCTPGSIIPTPNTNFAINKQKDGILKLLFLDYTPTYKENIEASGLFADLIFKVLGSSSQSTPIKISDAALVDKNLNVLNTSINEGKVNILEALPTEYTFSGYINSDYFITSSEKEQTQQAFAKEGFKVALTNSTLSALTDSTGYFEIKNVPVGTYTAKITKTNYLAREKKGIVIDKNKELSSRTNPILLYIGDLEVNGKQDGVINLTDIMEICKAFNSVSGESKYQENLDLNKDGAINLEEIVIISKNYNKTSSKYQ